MLFLKHYGDLSPTDPDFDKSSFHEFKDYGSAHNWANGLYEKWAQKHKELFKRAEQYNAEGVLHISDPLELYFGEEYRNVNSYLRDESIKSKRTYALTQILHLSLLTAPKINMPLVLYRFVCDEMINKLIKKNKMESATPFQESGFMSTSMTKQACIKNAPKDCSAILKLYVPAEVHAVYANCIVPRDELELLLIPGLFLKMISKPYKETKSDKIIYETQVINMYS